MNIITVSTLLPLRLDRYLKKLYPLLTQGVIEQALRHKQILVNNQKAAASLRVIEWDMIAIHPRLNLPIEPLPVEEKFFSSSVVKLAEKILGSYLIYEDDNLLVINKPNNLASQGGSKISLSIDDALGLLNSQGRELKLVHRLDKETSGCFLIAKNYAASVKLGQAFEDKIITKTYYAVTLGSPQKKEGEISNLINKKRGGVFESVVEDKEEGKLAITLYKLLEKHGNVSLIEFTPLTGRMHQLRFHAQQLNIPIIGDKKYGSAEAASRSPNMLLHAKMIKLPEQIFGNEIIIEAKLPKYFKKFIGG